MLSIIQAGSLHHPPGQPQNHSQPFHSGFQAAYLCLRNKNQPWPDLPCIPIISLFALDTTCQVYSHWVIHPQGHFKAHTHSFADNVIYSLQKGKSTAKWPLVYLEVLPFTLSLPVYLQTCTREKKNLYLMMLLCQLLSWSHLWLISPLQSLRTSHQVPKISVIPIITHSPSPSSEILTLVTLIQCLLSTNARLIAQC